MANILVDFSHVCPRCYLPETTSHVIRDCVWAKDVWIALPGQRPINFFLLPLASWLKEYLIQQHPEIHNYNPPSATRSQMVHKTLHLSSEFLLLIHPRVSNIPKCILNISWKPPVDPFVTLNTDDSTLGNKKFTWEMDHWILFTYRLNNE